MEDTSPKREALVLGLGPDGPRDTVDGQNPALP